MKKTLILQKMLLVMIVSASTIAILFPETGITVERTILGLVYGLAVVKTFELF